MNLAAPSPSCSEDLCLACGLCCNGVLFADVKLQPGDQPARLRALGLSLPAKANSRTKLKLPQPCPAFDGCRCRIYAERPSYCRQFECLLLKRAKAGQVNQAAALRLIRRTRQKAAKAQLLLRKLGDTDEHLPLAKRFHRTTRRLQETGTDSKTAQLYGQLTLVVQDLNVLLSQHFYPG